MDEQPPSAARRLAAGVCLVEAVAAGSFAALLIRTARVGEAVDVVAASVQAALAAVVALALVALGLALARGRRWPIGLVTTTQFLVAVVVLSQFGTTLRSGQGRALMLAALVAALVTAAAGLWSVARLAVAYHRTPPGPAARGRG